MKSRGIRITWKPLFWACLILAILPIGTILGRVLAADGHLDMLPYGYLVAAARMAAGVVAAGLVLIRPDANALKKWTISGFAFAFALAVAEIGARIVYSPETVTSGWRSTAPRTERNQLHYRGQSIEYSDSDFVVVLLGDSHVEALGCDFAAMPEPRLERHLNDASTGRRIKVFSLGASGYGQDQQLLALKEYFLDRRADLVVLWQEFGNDVWNNMFPTHWVINGHPKPTFRLSDGRLIGPALPPEHVTHSRSSVRLVDLIYNTWQSRMGLDEKWEPFFPEAYRPILKPDGDANDFFQRMWDSDPELNTNDVLSIEKSYLSIFLEPPSARFQYGMDLMRALIGEIESVAAGNGARFCIFHHVLPDSGISDASQIYEVQGRRYRASLAQRRRNEEYVNSGFKTIAITVTVEDYKVAEDDPHLNERAVDQVTRDLAAALTANEMGASDRRGKADVR